MTPRTPWTPAELDIIARPISPEDAAAALRRLGSRRSLASINTKRAKMRQKENAT